MDDKVLTEEITEEAEQAVEPAKEAAETIAVEPTESAAEEEPKELDIEDALEEQLEKLAEKAEVEADKVKDAFADFKAKAVAMMSDDGEMEAFLVKLEQKMSEVPMVGGGLKNIPLLASMLRSYVMQEYRLAPVGTMVAVVIALLYWVSPIDLIPDMVPGIGYLDDAMVVTLCWKMVEADVEAYDEWRKEHGSTYVEAQVIDVEE